MFEYSTSAGNKGFANLMSRPAPRRRQALSELARLAWETRPKRAGTHNVLMELGTPKVLQEDCR